MLLSMTGFGRGEARIDSGVLQVEIRSVNHRFGEVSIRLPRGLSLLEGKVRERVQERLTRGKINVTIALEGEDVDSGRLRLNRVAVARYRDVLEELKSTLGLAGEIDLTAFLNLPDLLVWDREELSEDAGWNLLRPAVDRALDDILSMKKHEGEALGRDLLGRLNLMTVGLDRIEGHVPQMVAGLRERISRRLAEAGQDLEYNKSRLETEIVLFADRTDCTEECIRLRSHLQMFQDLIAAPEPAGRKLNFLLQEMNREANTIGSKAQEVNIAREVIGLKEEIERIREQVQNFE